MLIVIGENMFRAHGFGEITYKGVTYEVKPSFKNIDRLGGYESIKDISNFLFSGFEVNGEQWLISVFERAKKVLKVCSNLPDDYYDNFKVMPSGKVRPTKEGLINCHAAIAVARRCLVHGVISDVKAKRSGSSEGGDSFDASEYVRSAMKIFNISKKEAADMTMTEFVTYCNDMVEDVSEGKNLTGKEKRQLILEQMEKDEKARKAKMEREGK